MTAGEWLWEMLPDDLRGGVPVTPRYALGTSDFSAARKSRPHQRGPGTGSGLLPDLQDLRGPPDAPPHVQLPPYAHSSARGSVTPQDTPLAKIAWNPQFETPSVLAEGFGHDGGAAPSMAAAGAQMQLRTPAPLTVNGKVDHAAIVVPETPLTETLGRVAERIHQQQQQQMAANELESVGTRSLMAAADPASARISLRVPDTMLGVKRRRNTLNTPVPQAPARRMGLTAARSGVGGSSAASHATSLRGPVLGATPREDPRRKLAQRTSAASLVTPDSLPRVADMAAELAPPATAAAIRSEDTATCSNARLASVAAAAITPSQDAFFNEEDDLLFQQVPLDGDLLRNERANNRDGDVEDDDDAERDSMLLEPPATDFQSRLRREAEEQQRPRKSETLSASDTIAAVDEARCTGFVTGLNLKPIVLSEAAARRAQSLFAEVSEDAVAKLAAADHAPAKKPAAAPPSRPVLTRTQAGAPPSGPAMARMQAAVPANRPAMAKQQAVAEFASEPRQSKHQTLGLAPRPPVEHDAAAPSRPSIPNAAAALQPLVVAGAGYPADQLAAAGTADEAPATMGFMNAGSRREIKVSEAAMQRARELAEGL